jgi:pimeloyl-ACP methyl ester carboxylesterase
MDGEYARLTDGSQSRLVKSAAMTQLTPRASAWHEAGALTEVSGHQIFVREQPGTGDGPPVVLLHGYPSSSFDWRHAFDLLPAHHLIGFDFLGFGLSDKPRGQVYSLNIQADIAEAIVGRFVKGPVVLVAHDMGSSVATELLARDIEGRLSFELASAVIFNASLVRERASLLWGQKLLLSRLGPLATRLTSEFGFRRQFAGIFSREHPLSDEEAADQWSLLARNGGHRLLDRLIFYNHERVGAPGRRWHEALRNWPGRLELAWAQLDPICTEAVLQAVLDLRPHAELSRLPGLGHYPQIEDPPATMTVIERHAADA